MVRPVGVNHASDNSTTGNVAQIVRPVAPVDSMYDDDIYGDAPAAAAVSTPVVEAAWINSDNVDFGEYIDLDQAHKQLQLQTEQRKRQQVHASQASSGGIKFASRGGVSSTEAAVNSVLRRGPALGDPEGGDDEDEDAVEDEAEGLSYRKKASGRRTQDIPDDSDEENE